MKKHAYFAALLSLVIPQHCFGIGANVFEVGSGTIHDTIITTTYDTFNFQTDFADTPAVFIIGDDNGNNSCEVRLQNVGVSSFEAVCAEDSSWDGQHLPVDVQYIAMSEGVQTIPTNNGGSVTFEVGCEDMNDVQHNCTSGCPTESSQPISFSAGFSSAPVVLAHIQTSNNHTSSPAPVNSITPMLSVSMDSITSSGFNLAMDMNKEDGIGSVSDERVCWLAVEETSQCDLGGIDDTLNFSSIGGPSSVAFEAIITNEVVDGWDNGCNNNEGANFTSGCFTSTPIAVATKRSRNEEEGWLRYCRLNTGQFRVTIDEQRVTGQNRQHVDESVNVLAFGSAFTTPVSLSSFEAKVRGSNRVLFKWETESESFNVGFNIWGQVAGEWQQLNRHTIPAKQGDFSEPQSYKRALRIPVQLLAQVEKVGLSSVDNSGFEEFFGPFDLNEKYGQETSMEPIDWSQVKADYESRMLESGYVKLRNNRWVRSNRSFKRRLQNREFHRNHGGSVVELSVQETGVVKVSFAEILERVPEWEGLSIDQIALTNHGKAVSRKIESDDNLIDQNDNLIFLATENPSDTNLYTQAILYRLVVDHTLVSKIPEAPSMTFDEDTLSQSGYQELAIGKDSVYFVASKSGDPWFDKQLMAFSSPASHSYDLVLYKPLFDRPVKVVARVAGGIKLPGEGFDHHVKLYLNDHFVAESSFNGFTDKFIQGEVDAGVIADGINTLKVELPADTGKFADIINIDSVSVTYDTLLELDQGRALKIIADKDRGAYRIRSQASDLSVFAQYPTGLVAQLRASALSNGDHGFVGVPTEHHRDGLAYHVVGSQGYIQPDSIRVVNTKNLRSGLRTQYLIVAHPNFMGSDLDEFADHKREQGFSVNIVDWFDIVDTYGHGYATPNALKNYMRLAENNRRLKYLLLVGGHSYDYNDYLGQGSVSFIPAAYEAVSTHFQFAPTDNHYADTDGDGLPNVAVGRWPVRDIADLKKIVQKTMTWSENSPEYSHRTLLISDATDSTRGQDFQTQIDNLMERTGLDPTNPDISEIYLDRYLSMNTDTPVEDAKQELLNQLDNDSPGIGLTVFNGHASSSRWTYRNLLNAGDVTLLNNTDKPTTIMPLACYTTYYETPSVNSLAHQLLFESQGGAALITGAAYLSEDRENAKFGSDVLSLMKTKGVSWGQAVLRVKSKMMPWNDSVTNWTTLGDPSLKLSF